MINKSPRSLFLQCFLPGLDPTEAPEAPTQRQGRDRAGIKGMGKLGRTTLLDVRSPLISQTFPIRKKKPEAFAYQKRIFDLSLLCCSPPGPPRSEEPCQHYRNSICKTICKAGLGYILPFKKQIFHIMSCGDFCDVAFFFLNGLCVEDGCQRHQPNKQL